jgi:hypothetical protein
MTKDYEPNGSKHAKHLNSIAFPGLVDVSHRQRGEETQLKREDAAKEH